MTNSVTNPDRLPVVSPVETSRPLDALRARLRSPRRSAATGPFSGQHVSRPSAIVPPEWDMTPQEYAVVVDLPPVPVATMAMSGAWVVAGAGVWSAPVGAVALADLTSMPTPVAFGVGALVWTGGAVTLARNVWRERRWRHQDETLGHLDPAEVLNIGTTLPHHVWNLLHEIVSLNDISPEAFLDRELARTFKKADNSAYLRERAERLAFGYTMALTFERPDMPDKMWKMRDLIASFPEQMQALATYGSQMRAFTARASAKEILAALIDAEQRHAASEQLKADLSATGEATSTVRGTVTSLPQASTGSMRKSANEWQEAARWGAHVSRKNSKWASMNFPVAYTHTEQQELLNTLTEMATHTPARTVQSGFEAQWADAVATHDRVIEAWTELVTDPLAALDHSLLLDVTQPRTAAFIEAYGEAQDLRALHGTTYPMLPTSERVEEVVRGYLRAVRRADEAWTEAIRHARHVHLNWLPAEEAKRVRQASALLRTADDDTTPLHLRVEAAQKAADLLKQVHTFSLPAATATAIEAKARLALPAGT